VTFSHDSHVDEILPVPPTLEEPVDRLEQQMAELTGNSVAAS
jgi:hypothetical protein